jgi:hypothetical protein
LTKFPFTRDRLANACESLFFREIQLQDVSEHIALRVKSDGAQQIFSGRNRRRWNVQAGAFLKAMELHKLIELGHGGFAM